MRSIRPKLGLSLLIVLALAAFLSRSRKPTKGDPYKILPSTTSQEAVAPIRTTASEERAQILSWRNQEQAAALTRAPFPIVQGEMKLELKALIKRTCYPGDANAILLDQKEMPAKKLLLTLERLDRKGETIVFEIPSALFQEGKARQDFSLPVNENPVLYGLYLCLSTYTKSCKGKPSRDINEIFTQHMNRKLLTLEDRNYFFQMVMVDTQGAAAFYRHPKGDQPFSELSHYLNNRSKESAEQANFVPQVKGITHTLGSLPVAFSKKGIELSLPLYDPIACQSSVAQK